jgi:hypothetical protein
MTRGPHILTLIAALAAAGCGITNPYQAHAPRPAATTTTHHTSTTAPDSGDPAAERGGTIPSVAHARQTALSPRAGTATPQAALEHYARLETTWAAAELPARQRQLADISLGQARAAALQAAASAARDPELTRSHVTNIGQVIAITPGAGPAASHWVVVTRETTTGQGDYAGLPAAVHVTYAQVTHTPTGWVVNQWSPQT